MKILVDTRIALWIVEGSDRLSSTSIQIIEDQENTLYVSAAAIWEIAIKHSKGKLKVHPREARATFHLSGLIELPVSGDHAQAAATLPLFPDHNDPFDRIMIAQALHETMPLLTTDKKLCRYHPTLVIPA